MNAHHVIRHSSTVGCINTTRGGTSVCGELWRLTLSLENVQARKCQRYVNNETKRGDDLFTWTISMRGV